MLVENIEQNDLTLEEDYAEDYKEAYSSLELVMKVYPLPKGLDRQKLTGEVTKWRKDNNIHGHFFVTTLGRPKLEVSTLRRDIDLMNTCSG